MEIVCSLWKCDFQIAWYTLKQIIYSYLLDTTLCFEGQEKSRGIVSLKKIKTFSEDLSKKEKKEIQSIRQQCSASPLTDTGGWYELVLQPDMGGGTWSINSGSESKQLKPSHHLNTQLPIVILTTINLYFTLQ